MGPPVARNPAENDSESDSTESMREVPRRRRLVLLPRISGVGVVQEDRLLRIRRDAPKSHVNLCCQSCHIPFHGHGLCWTLTCTTNLRKSRRGAAGGLSISRVCLKVKVILRCWLSWRTVWPRQMSHRISCKHCVWGASPHCRKPDNGVRGAGHCCRRVHPPVGGAHFGEAIFGAGQRSDGSSPVRIGNPRRVRVRGGHGRLWPNRLWPKPTLAKPTLAKPTLAKPTLAKPTYFGPIVVFTDFGQTDFGQFFDRLWPIVVFTDFGQTDFGQFWCFSVLAKFSCVVVVVLCCCCVCCCRCCCCCGLLLLLLLLLLLCVVVCVVGSDSAGPPSAGALRRTAQNFALFLPFPATVSLFLALFEFWWCFEDQDPQMCTRGRRGFTGQPENSKRAHLSVPALQTPPKIPRENPPERHRNSETVAGEGRKSAKFWAPHPFGAPPFRCPTLCPTLSGPTFSGPHPFGAPPFRGPTLSPTLRGLTVWGPTLRQRVGLKRHWPKQVRPKQVKLA